MGLHGVTDIISVMGANGLTINASFTSTSLGPIAPAPLYPMVQMTSIAKTGDTFDVIVGRLPQKSILVVPAGTYQWNDFLQGGDSFGLYQTNLMGIQGPGSKVTKLRMNPNSSTQASKVPTQAAGGTNPLYLLRLGTGTSAASTPWLSGVTIEGTAQGHYYNGVYIYHATNAWINDVVITGIPGNNSSPPGETFGINDYDSVGSTYNYVEVDGRDAATGVGVGSANFGTNSSSNITRWNCYSHHSAYGAGYTEFQNANLNFYYCRSEYNNKSGYNFERATGTVNLVGCTAIGNTGAPIIADSDQASTVFNISGMTTDIGTTVTVLSHKTYSWPPGTPNPNLQKQSDFHMTAPNTVTFVTSFGAIRRATYKLHAVAYRRKQKRIARKSLANRR